MARREVAVEHVLHPVGGVEHHRHDPLAGLADAVEEQRLALVVNQPRLLEEPLLVEHPLVQGPGVLGEPERREAAEQLRQVGGVVGGVGDRQRRPLGSICSGVT